MDGALGLGNLDDLPAIENMRQTIKSLHDSLSIATATASAPQWDLAQRRQADDVELAVRTLIQQQLQATADIYANHRSSYLELQEAIKDEEMRYNVVLNTIFEQLVKGVDKQSLDDFNGTLLSGLFVYVWMYVWLLIFNC